MNNSRSYIELVSINKSYSSPDNNISILNNISLKLDRGSLLVITGESGSGKTTLLNLIGGLDRPNSGEIWVGGVQVSALREQQMYKYRQSKIGFIFQFHHLLRDFTALENISLPAYMAGINNAQEKAVELIKLVGLEDRMNNFPHQLSGGECQRVAICRALINQPALILADEPTGSLDETRSREIEAILFEILKAKGQTLIIVTHDNRLSHMGDYHLHLSKGNLA